MRHYWLTSDAPDLPEQAFRKALTRNRPATLEGGKGGSAPEAPDPFKTAAATTQTNQQTAAFNKALNLNNYTNPFGSQQTVQTGTDPNTGAPIYGTTISANPQIMGAINNLFGQVPASQQVGSDVQSGLYSLNSNLNNLGGNFQNLAQQYAGLNSGVAGLQNQINGAFGNQSQALGNLQSQIDMNAVKGAQQQGQNAAYAAQTQYLDPQFSQQKESLDAQLANQGLTPGSEAYNNAMLNYNNQKQQAYSNAQNQAILTGSQLGTQNLQNQLSGINAQAGLIGQQSGITGQQGSLGAGLFGLQGSNLQGAGGLYGQQGNIYNSQGGILGQLLGSAQLPYSQLGSLAQFVPGYSGTAQSSSNPADIAGNINNQYQAQLANHNADVASGNQTMSTIGTVAGIAAIAF